jgi:hypothetical protein
MLGESPATHSLESYRKILALLPQEGSLDPETKKQLEGNALHNFGDKR